MSKARLEAFRPAFFAPKQGFEGDIAIRFSVDDVTRETIAVIGSKSYSNRALVLAGLSKSRTQIDQILFSEDTFWACDALLRLGYELEVNVEERQIVVSPPQKTLSGTVEIQLGKAGTLARFFPALALHYPRIHNRPEVKMRLSGEPQLERRPLTPLVEALKKLGACIDGDQLPMVVSQSVLRGKTEISGAVSGQFLSGLLIAAAAASDVVEIERTETLVQPDYIQMTLACLRDFGAHIESDCELKRFLARPVDGLRCDSYVVEADASTACYFISYACLHNLRLKITNLSNETLQPDLEFAKFLKSIGYNVETTSTSVEVQPRTNVAMGTFCRPLSGGQFDFKTCSDQAMTAAIFGIFAPTEISVTGVAHIRHHESNRLASLLQNFKALGAPFFETSDGFCTSPAEDTVAGTWNCFDDHRFAMSGFLLASCEPSVSLRGVSCVEKTAPQFFSTFEALGARIQKVKTR